MFPTVSMGKIHKPARMYLVKSQNIFWGMQKILDRRSPVCYTEFVERSAGPLFFVFGKIRAKFGIKKEVTPDCCKPCSFRLFKQQPGVTSPYSYYLTSLINLSFCEIDAAFRIFEIHSSHDISTKNLRSEINFMWEYFTERIPRPSTPEFEPVGFTCTSVSPFLALI